MTGEPARSRGPSPGGPLSLSSARLVSGLMYLCSLGAYILVGSVIRPQASVNLPIFPWIMVGVGIADYVVSLVIEGALLGRRSSRGSDRAMSAGLGDQRAVTVATIVSAFGMGLGVYGLVVALLGFGKEAWILYGLCALHGIHLQLRWDRYEEAVRRAQR
jgi:hypothetical protein